MCSAHKSSLTNSARLSIQQASLPIINWDSQLVYKVHNVHVVHLPIGDDCMQQLPHNCLRTSHMGSIRAELSLHSSGAATEYIRPQLSLHSSGDAIEYHKCADLSRSFAVV